MKNFNLFKRFSQTIAGIAIIVSSVCFINSCKKDNISGNTDQTIEKTLDNLPTEDQLYVKCSLPTYISPNIQNDNGLASAVKKRFTNPSSTMNKDTKVFFLDAKDIFSFNAAELDLIAEAYNNNARFLVYNPSLSNIFELDENISSELLATIAYDDINSYVESTLEELMDEDPQEEEKWILYGLSKHDDFYQKPFGEHKDKEEITTKFTITNENGELVPADECLIASDEQHDMTAFEYGLFADSAISWINSVEENEEQTKALSKSLISATKAGDKDLENLLQYKTITHSISYTTRFSDVKTAGWEKFVFWLGSFWIHGSEFARIVPVEVQIQYAGIHNFDDNCDYFIFKQHLKSSNHSYSCPIKQDTWTNTNRSGANKIYTCGPYMKGISVSNKLVAYKTSNGSVPTIDNDAKIELMSGKCLPSNVNKETPVNQSIDFGLGISKKGLSFGLGGFKASAGLDGFNMSIKQQYNIDKITVVKTSVGSQIAWDYEGGRIKGHARGVRHDEVPVMQRADCDMDQAYIFRIENPNNSQIVHSTRTSLTSEVLYGQCAPLIFYDHYQEITQKQAKPNTFVLHRLARYPYTWRMFIDMDESKAKQFESFLANYFKKYSTKVIEAYDIYSKDELKDKDLWNNSWLGAYFNTFENELKASADIFRSVGGPGAGSYKISFKNTESDQIWDVVYNITVPETGEVDVNLEYKGFAWSK